MEIKYRVRFCLLSVVVVFTVASALRAQTLDKLEAIAAQATDIDDFLEKPKLLEAYSAALRSYYGSDRYRCESFERVLAQFKLLKDAVPGLKEKLWQTTPSRRFTFYQMDSEGKKAKAAKKGETAPTVTYEFRSVARRFHAIWNDPSQGGCISEYCGKADATAPERWTALLDGAELFLVEKNGLFNGASVLLLPARRGSEIFGLVSASGSADWNRPQKFYDPISGNPQQTTLLKLWLFRAFLEKPPSWQNLLLVNRDLQQEELAAQKRELRAEQDEETPSATPARETAGDFVPLDPLAPLFVKALPRRCFASESRDGRDLLAGVKPRLGPLTKPPLSPSVFLAWSLKDPTRQKMVVDSLDARGSIEGLRKLAPGQTTELEVVLSRTLLKHPDAAKRARAGLALDRLQPVAPEDVAGIRDRGQAGDTSAEKISKRPSLAPATFQKALADRNPVVRGIAGMGLLHADRGSPAAAHAAAGLLTPESFSRMAALFTSSPSPASPANLGDALAARQAETTALPTNVSPSAPAPASITTPSPSMEVATRAGEAMQSRGYPIPREGLFELADRTLQESDPDRRRAMISHVSRFISRHPDLVDSYRVLRKLANAEAPERVDELVDALDDSANRCPCRRPSDAAPATSQEHAATSEGSDQCGNS